MENKISSSSLAQILDDLSQRLLKSAKKAHLLVGGAGALVGVYNYRDSTSDVDAIALGASLDDFARELSEVGAKFSLPPDWMNPHFSTFTIYLPKDYKKRCLRFFESSSLTADALGPEDLMIMKLMAGRTKDQSHLRFLMKEGPVDLTIVENRLTELKALFPKEAEDALNLFDDLQDEFT